MLGVTILKMVFAQESPIRRAVVSQEAVELLQGIFHHQVRRGEIVHHVAQDDEGKVYSAADVPVKHQKEGDTDDHAGDGVGHQGDALDDHSLPLPAQTVLLAVARAAP